MVGSGLWFHATLRHIFDIDLTDHLFQALIVIDQKPDAAPDRCLNR